MKPSAIKLNEFSVALKALGHRLTECHERDQQQTELLRGELQRVGEQIRSKKHAGKWIRTYVNVFDVLGRPRLEMAHSSVIRWLLDPNESHGLGDYFLCQLLKIIGPLRPLETGGAEVILERTCAVGRIDIFVRGHGWSIVIENKIDSVEGHNQTIKYEKERHGCVGDSVFLVFLTPSGRAPQSQGFTCVSYRQLREILEGVNVSPDAGVIIRHFRDHILYDIES